MLSSGSLYFVAKVVSVGLKNALHSKSLGLVRDRECKP